MAGDTRDFASQHSHTASPEGNASAQDPYQGKHYEVFDDPPAATPPESANVLPGGAANTAGGRQKEANLIDALRMMKLSDFTEVHKKPCVRESLLTSILSAFGVGGLRAVSGASIPKASNWAVGTFMLVSFGAHEFCQRRRALERQTMERAAEIIDRKKLEKARKAEVTRAARRKAREEAERLKEVKEEEARRKENWKFW